MLKQMYGDSVVAEVKKNLTKNLESWKNSLYNIKYEVLKATRPSHTVSAHGRSGTYNTNNKFDRVLVGISSFGITEIERACENADFRKEAQNYVDKMVVLRSELDNIQFN